MKSLSSKLTNRINKEEILAMIASSPEHFQTALSISMSTDQPQAWRAAWMLNHCVRKNDVRIQPYILKLIHSIDNKIDGQQRELLKILTKMKLDDEQEGRLFDKCMTLWETISKSPSVRIFAFKFLYRMLKKYPELKEEMDFITQDHYIEPLSPGILRSVMKMKKELGL